MTSLAEKIRDREAFLARLREQRGAAGVLRRQKEAAEAERRRAVEEREESDRRDFGPRLPPRPSAEESKAMAQAAAASGIAANERRAQAAAFLRSVEDAAAGARHEASDAAQRQDMEGYVAAHGRATALAAMTTELERAASAQQRRMGASILPGTMPL